MRSKDNEDQLVQVTPLPQEKSNLMELMFLLDYLKKKKSVIAATWEILGEGAQFFVCLFVFKLKHRQVFFFLNQKEMGKEKNDIQGKFRRK